MSYEPVPIIGQTSRVVTKPIFDADGHVVAMTEAQSANMAELVRQEAGFQRDRLVPLAGNTQRHWRHVAEIPNVIVNDLMRRGIWWDHDALTKWLDTECPRDFKTGAL